MNACVNCAHATTPTVNLCSVAGFIARAISASPRSTRAAAHHLAVARGADERLCHVLFSTSEFTAIPAKHGKADGAVEFATALRRAAGAVGYADARVIGYARGGGTVAACLAAGV